MRLCDNEIHCLTKTCYYHLLWSGKCAIWVKLIIFRARQFPDVRQWMWGNDAILLFPKVWILRVPKIIIIGKTTIVQISSRRRICRFPVAIIFVRFRNNVGIIYLIAHYDNTPFWIPVGTNKDDLEWPWMPDSTLSALDGRHAWRTCTYVVASWLCVTEWGWPLLSATKMRPVNWFQRIWGLCEFLPECTAVSRRTGVTVEPVNLVIIHIMQHHFSHYLEVCVRLYCNNVIYIIMKALNGCLVIQRQMTLKVYNIWKLHRPVYGDGLLAECPYDFVYYSCATDAVFSEVRDQWTSRVWRATVRRRA